MLLIVIPFIIIRFDLAESANFTDEFRRTIDELIVFKTHKPFDVEANFLLGTALYRLGDASMAEQMLIIAANASNWSVGRLTRCSRY